MGPDCAVCCGKKYVYSVETAFEGGMGPAQKPRSDYLIRSRTRVADRSPEIEGSKTPSTDRWRLLERALGGRQTVAASECPCPMAPDALQRQSEGLLAAEKSVPSTQNTQDTSKADPGLALEEQLARTILGYTATQDRQRL